MRHKRILYLLSLTWCSVALAAPAGIKRVEAGLLPPISIAGQPLPQMNMIKRMAHYRVPAVSIAVIEGNKVGWSRAYGQLTPGGSAATTATLFQAASLSKPVTAAAALKLVHDKRLSLDAPVNRYLTSWKLPDSEAGRADAVTLRRLLSHTAGLSTSGFDGYEAGAPLPSLRQVLDGAPPANSEPVRIAQAPGRWRYSGGGYTIVQQMIEDGTKQPFPAALSRTLLSVAGMRDSIFSQPLPGRSEGHAAVAHARNGQPVAGRWRVHPELAAAGLWTTPTDLARFALWVMDGAAGRGTTPAQGFVARHMIERQPTSGEGGATTGLGFSVVGEGRALQIRHNGQNEGYAAVMVAFPETGQGAVIMTNGDGGRPLIDEILRAIAAEYKWPTAFHEQVTTVRLEPAQLQAVAGTYSFGSGPNEQIAFGVNGDALTVSFGPRKPAPLLAIDAKTFIDPHVGARFRFEPDSVTLTSSNGAPLTATRRPGAGASPSPSDAQR